MIEEGLNETLFPGALAPFRNKVIVNSDPAASALDQPALLDVLARFQCSVRGTWQPACSLWAQFYFNTVLIPATCLLSSEGDWTGRVDAIGATFCSVSGTPLNCDVQTADHDRGGLELADCLAAQVDATIASLNAVSRLSKSMLRESATHTLSWTLNEISLADPVRAKATEARLWTFGRCWFEPSGKNNPMAVRRLCCLRDRLPNVPSCGAICPRNRKRFSCQIE